MRKLILALLAAGILSAQPTAIRDDQALFNNGWNFRYSVDSVNGSDLNDGLSKWRPFQTYSKLVAQPFGNYYTVGLARGSYWRGGTTGITTADYVGAYAYGSGARPIIDGAEVCSSWTKTGGLTNTYQCAVTFDASASVNQLAAFENGAYLTQQTSTANVDANAGSCYFSSFTTSPATLYVHATGNGNPGTNGNTYEYASHSEQWSPAVAHGANRAQGWYVHGLHTTRNVSPSGSMVFGRLARVYDSVADYGANHNIFFADGCLLQDSTIGAGYGGDNVFALYEPSPIGLGCTLRRVTINSTPSPVPAGAMISHTGGSGAYGPIVLDTLTVASPLTLSLSNPASLTVLGGSYTSIGTSNGPTFQVNAPTTLSNVTWNGYTTSGVVNINGNFPATITNSNLTYNGLGLIYCLTSSSTVDLEGSTIYKSGGAGSMFTCGSASGTITRLNNTFGSFNTGSTMGGSTGTATVVSDYNTINNTSATQLRTLYDTQYTTGQDIHSTPNITASTLVRWNLGSAYVSGSNIPDLDGHGLNLSLATGGATSQTAGVLFGAGQWVPGPQLASIAGVSWTMTAVAKWTGTPGSLAAKALITYFQGVGQIWAGNTASKAGGVVDQFNDAAPVSTSSVDDGNWHAITIIAQPDNIYLWVDGTQQGTPTSSHQDTAVPGTNAITVGSNSAHSASWTGQIAYVEYLSGQIPTTQMAAYYAGLKSSLAAQGVTLP